MDDICLPKMKKKLETLNTGSEDIQAGYRDGIWHRKMCHANNKKRETKYDRRNSTTKSRINQNVRRKKLQVFGNIGSGHHQTSRDERKNL